MQQPAESFLNSDTLDALVGRIDPARAAAWPDSGDTGDTVWLGAIDADGCAVSFIQSVFWEFGSGAILPATGVTWQNRGTSFSLDANHHNCLKPGRRPFHTIQPALAVFDDGRVMPYGTMGGEGQPQTQAMVFTRYAFGQQALQESVTAPRWLLGKTWGSEKTNLRIESRFDEEVYRRLIEAGHDLERVGAYEGLIEGAADPRSDGQVAGW